jgi:hypothetical protein
MSEALISQLQRQIDSLTSENATLKGEAKDRRIAGKRLKAELETARGQLASLTTERDAALKGRDEAAKALADSPSEWQRKFTELQGQVVRRDHRDAWAKALGDQLADKVSPEDVWSKIPDFKAEGDLPSAEAIAERAKAVREAAPYLFKPAETAGQAAAGAATEPITTGRREAGPGAGRGVETRPQTDPLATTQAHNNKAGIGVFGRL